MKIIEAIEKRRSIRKYTDQKVKKADLEELIRLATLAPSAHNRQPWRFYIALGDKKKRIVDMINKYCENTEDVMYKTVSFTASVIDNVSSLIIVMKEKDEKWHYLDILGIGAAIQNINLGALDFGLGTLWINHTDCVKDEIVNYLGFENFELVSVIAVGYPDQDPKPRPRKKIEEVFFN